MPVKPSSNTCCGVNSMINRHIGTAYDNVKIVVENIDIIEDIGNNLPYLLKYLGVYSSAPTERPDGTPLENGDYYFDSTAEALVYYNLSSDEWFIVDPQDVLIARDEAIAAKNAAEQAQGLAENATDQAEAFSLSASSSANAAAASAVEAQDSADTLAKKLGGAVYSFIMSGVSSKYAVGDVVDFDEFFENSNVGKGSWLKTAQIDTPSLTPALMGDATFTDTAGNVWQYLPETLGYSVTALGVITGTQDSSGALKAALANPRTLLFPAGRISITGSVDVMFGTEFITAGWETEFWFSGMTTSTDCFNVVRGPTLFERMRNLTIGKHKLVLNDSDARYGWVTPTDANVWAYERPYVDIECFVMAPDRAASFTPYTFEEMVKIGDCRGGDILLVGYGGYKINQTPIGQRAVMGGMAIGGATGNIGLDIKLLINNVRRGLNILDGTEGFVVTGEVVGCDYGIDTINQSLVEPGGFIDNMHVNAGVCGYRLINRPEVSIGQASAYKADGFFNDGTSEWVGFDIGSGSGATIGSIKAIPGSAFSASRNTALRVDGNGWPTSFESLDARNCGDVINLNNATDFKGGKTNAVACLKGYVINGASTARVTLGKVTDKDGTLAPYVEIGSAVPDDAVQYSQEEMQVSGQGAINISADGTTELSPIASAKFTNVIVISGTAAYTHVILLDDTINCVEGAEMTFKVSTPGSIDRIIEVRRKSDNALLGSPFTSGAGTRYFASYIYRSGLFQRNYVIEVNE